jgi:hypothetical protein
MIRQFKVGRPVGPERHRDRLCARGGTPESDDSLGISVFDGQHGDALEITVARDEDSPLDHQGMAAGRPSSALFFW